MPGFAHDLAGMQADQHLEGNLHLGLGAVADQYA
jgi:hypothetical protein